MKNILSICSGALLAGAMTFGASLSANAANLIVVNFDPPGEGLNDPSPATPEGGNPGTTVGEQRINAYLKAAEIWGATLDSDVDIFVAATFTPLPCDAQGGVLGAAGPTFAEIALGGSTNPDIEADTWYAVALWNSLVGEDIVPGFVHISSLFNADLGSPGCLENSGWYYGFDNNQGAGQIDFLSVVLHEIGHGLGFLDFADEDTGAMFGESFFGVGYPNSYERKMFDTAQNKAWPDLTNAERLLAQVAGDDLVFTGDSTTAAAPAALGPRPSIRILRPKSLRGTVKVQQASFGPPLETGGGTTGQVRLADDGDDSLGSTTDACEPLRKKLNGKIALIDRGGCAFTTKALNAQAAGAKGVMIANNVPGGPAPVGGFSPDVTIPTVGITLDQGNAFKAAGKANVKLILDPSKLAGANDDGFVQLYAPNPVQPGSSKSHFDTSATPNLLMEPSITPDLESATDLDLTPNVFEDIGWKLLP